MPFEGLFVLKVRTQRTDGQGGPMDRAQEAEIYELRHFHEILKQFYAILKHF